MSDNFKNRGRYSLEKVKELCETGNTINHIIDNEDGTYSVMCHINCEHCDYCDLSNEWWDNKKSEGLSYDEICKLEKPTFKAQEDPYKFQKVYVPENYGLINSFNPENSITLAEVEKYWEKVISNTISLEDFKKVLVSELKYIIV